MSILGAVIVPHPPPIIPTVGNGREEEVQTTIDAYRAAAKQVAAWEPEVLIVTSPHQIMYADYFHISPGRGATGDMSAFGAPETKLAVEYDAPLRDEIIRCGESAGLQVGTLGQRDPYLDHGTFVPLYFLREAGVDCSILRIGLSGFSPLDHYRLGQCIAQAVESLGRRAVFIASGDLSHKLKDDGPYGFAPEGPEFDRQITEAMAAGAFVSLHAHGQLRGCIGTTGPTTESVAWEIVQNAVSACARDPRFPPVTVAELDSLEYSVDVLGQPEPISSSSELDVKRYGVIVSCGSRRGLLLPDLEGVDTVEQQIDIARQKGGISSREKYTLERFEVVRHT